VGRRLAIKLLNASKFALSASEPQGAITAPVDRAMLRRLASLIDEATRDLENYDYARVLQRVEEFFWRFCDDYLELVKGRRYQEQGPEGAASANAALTAALSALVRLFAPFLPFVTEEVWSWWQEGSVHRAVWPSRADIERRLPHSPADMVRTDQDAYEWATTVLFEVRKQRSEAKQPMRVPVTRVVVRAPANLIALMPLVEADLKSALRVMAFDVAAGDPVQIQVEGYEGT
jgi:valyl-tRNA synthetase